MKVDRHGYMNLTGQLVAIAGGKEHTEREGENGSGDERGIGFGKYPVRQTRGISGGGVEMKVMEP